MTEFPIWLVALIVAGAAPFLVRAFADEVERRHRRRTEDVLARVHAASHVTGQVTVHVTGGVSEHVTGEATSDVTAHADADVSAVTRDDCEERSRSGDTRGANESSPREGS